VNGNILNSKGVHVAVVTGHEVFIRSCVPGRRAVGSVKRIKPIFSRNFAARSLLCPLKDALKRSTRSILLVGRRSRRPNFAAVGKPRRSGKVSFRVNGIRPNRAKTSPLARKKDRSKAVSL
jgi:hypothetical protein